MPSKKTKTGLSQRLRALLPLFCILVCALILRLVFFTGMVRGDDLNYAHAAYEFANGRTHFDYWPNGTLRIGLYVPVAVLYASFGPSEITTLAFPFLSSLFTVVIIYGIGKLLDGEKAGLVAALLWACLPLDIFLASDLLADGPVTTFSAAAVYFWLLAESNKSPNRRTWYVAGVFCLLWAILIKPIAIVTLFFFLFYVVLKSWPKILSFLERKDTGAWLSTHRVLAASFVGALFFFLFVGYAHLQSRPLIVNVSRAATDFSRVLLTGETDIDLSIERVAQISLFSVLGPLILVSAVVLMLDRYAPARLALIWGGVYFLYYEWGTVGLNPLFFRPIINTEERSTLFILVPLVVIAAIYLARQISPRNARSTVVGSSAVVTLGALVFGQSLLRNAELPGFAFVELLAIGFIVASPFIALNLKALKGQLVGAAVVALIALALLKPAPPYNAGFWQLRRDELQDLRLAAEFLMPRDGLVYVDTYFLAISLNYGSDFNLGMDWAEEGRLDPEWRIRVGEPQSTKGGDYVISSTELQDSSAALHEVYRVGREGQWIIIYQVGQTNNAN